MISDLSENGYTGTIIIHGDIDDQIAMFAAQGNMTILAQAIGNNMDSSEEFKNLMLSFVGAYLSNNPDEKDQFLGGLELDSFPINLN